MSRLSFFFAALILLAAVAAPPRAHAATCTDAVNAWVDATLDKSMRETRRTLPYLNEKSDAVAHKESGLRLIKTESVKLRAEGYMLLLFRGDEETLAKAGEAADAMTTEQELAPFRFALGLYQLRTSNPEVAAKGRNNLIRVKEGRQIRFVREADWKAFTGECEIAK